MLIPHSTISQKHSKAKNTRKYSRYQTTNFWREPKKTSFRLPGFVYIFRLRYSKTENIIPRSCSTLVLIGFRAFSWLNFKSQKRKNKSSNYIRRCSCHVGQLYNEKGHTLTTFFPTSSLVLRQVGMGQKLQIET